MKSPDLGVSNPGDIPIGGGPPGITEMSVGHSWGHTVGCGGFRGHTAWDVDVVEVSQKEVWPLLKHRRPR